MNDFDRGARYAVKMEPEGTIRWLFPRLAESFHFHRWLDSQSAPRPGEPDRRCDTIAELVDEEGLNPPWAGVVELFSEPDSEALDRAVEYLSRFRRELRQGPHGRDKYPFAVGLVFLTGAARQRRLDMNLPGMPEVGLWFGPRVLDLSEEDALAHLESIEQNGLPRGLLVWVPLMTGGQSAEVVRRWRLLAETDERGLTLADLALNFARLAGCWDVWKEGLEGIMLKSSPYIDEVRAEMLQKAVLSVLEARFPGQVPAVVAERVKTEIDLARLEEWLQRASTASLEGFQLGMVAA